MAGKADSRALRVGGLALAALVGLALAGCETAGEGTSGNGSGEARPQASRSVQIVERDVEAPEVFQLTDQGLWDGRPSLGGVWIAHSEVGDPERVIIRNETSGEFVIGALFRRERENPGPRLQVSSDAAAALGMLAGQPTALNVTALRRQEVDDRPPAAAPAEDPAEEPATAVAEADTGTGTGSGTGAAPGAASGAQARTAEAPAEPRRAAESRQTAQAAPEAAEQPRRRFSLFGRRSAEPEPTPPAAARLTTNEIETMTLDNVASTAADVGAEAAAAASAAATGARSVSAPASTGASSGASSAGAAATASATATASRAAPSGGIDRPYVQIGIFSVEANATRASGLLEAEGLGAVTRREEHGGQASWRVLAGPADSTAARDRLVAAARRLGFQDAYAVRR